MEELPSKRFKPYPYSFLHPDLKRRHDEDEACIKNVPCQ